jgi:hypothetical protein
MVKTAQLKAAPRLGRKGISNFLEFAANRRFALIRFT